MAQIDELRTALLEAQATIEEQKKALEALTSPPLAYATVVSTTTWEKHSGEKVKALQVIVGTGLVLVEAPANKKFSPGETVIVHPMTSQVVGKAHSAVPGQTGIVLRKIDDLFSEVDVQGNTQILYHGDFQKLSSGDSVLVDRGMNSILRVLSEGTSRFDFEVDTHVTWDMIGGLAQAKQEMIDAIELPRNNPDLFAFYGMRPCKGVLLFGPPGCGKTMLGKAAATAVGSKGFMYIKGPEILERYVGVAEATIRNAFAAARLFQEKNGRPAVMFIDEADAILSKRGSGISSDMEKTIVPTFLSEMDGLENSETLVILTTNREDQLDPAVIRDGRIDKKIRVTRPEKQDVFSICEMLLKDCPVAKNNSIASLAEHASEGLFDAQRILYLLYEESGAPIPFNLSHTVNGAMVHSVIRDAKNRALHRDLSNKTRTGITKDDITAAISSIEHQNRMLEHTETMTEYVQTINKKIARVQRFSLEEYRAGAKAKKG